MTLFQEFSWVPHLLSIELKKTFSYRLPFWVKFVLGTGTELAVAYFLWKAVFETRKLTELQGFSFHGLVLYYLLAGFSAQITRGAERGYVSQEIFDGSLTRYLLYPLPFFAYKFVTHLAQQGMVMVQLVIALFFFWLVIGFPADQHLTLASFALGAGTCLLTGYLHFTILCCLEMVAFWQEVVWNLLIMMKFGVNLLGGAMVPLAFFPQWGQRLAQLTPFPALVSFPTRAFLGQLTLGDWLLNCIVLLCWSALFSCLTAWIWARGTRQYTGVGV